MSEPTTAELFQAIRALAGRIEALEGAQKRAPSKASPVRRIVRQVASEYNVSPDDILGPCRERVFVVARQEAMRRASDEGLSLVRIGNAMRRDHTTVLHGIRAAKARLGAAE